MSGSGFSSEAHLHPKAGMKLQSLRQLSLFKLGYFTTHEQRHDGFKSVSRVIALREESFHAFGTTCCYYVGIYLSSWWYTVAHHEGNAAHYD